MIYISHRGNTNGPVEHQENHPDRIIEVLHMGFDVEIDLWCIDNNLYLGHDEPIYLISSNFIRTRGLWLHCKNINAMHAIHNLSVNYFWHQNDDVTLTSKGYFWTYPGKQLTSNSILVMPETLDKIQKYNKLECAGVCSDFVKLIYDNR